MNDDSNASGWFALIVLLGMGITAMFTGCKEPDKAMRILSDQGYTEVHVTGTDWLGCGEHDWYRTKFTAKTPFGKVVSGTVCDGLLFKNATIRFQ